MASTIKHDCHDHPLQLMGTTETDGTAASCGACGLPFISGSQLFGCRCCNVFLHRSCASLSPSLERHPAYPGAPLYLRCSTDTFFCNICGKGGGSGFNYHSQTCDFVAHFLCPHLPRTAPGGGHQHPLSLVFETPAGVTIRCDVCGLQISHCYYKCSSCTVFDVHPWCLRRRPAGTTNSTAVTTNSTAGTTNSTAVTTNSTAKPSTEKIAWRITKWVSWTCARKLGMHLVLDPLFGLGEPLDIILFGAQDIADIYALWRDVNSVRTAFSDGSDDSSGLDIATFEDLPDCFEELLREEAVSLLWAHMERMAAGETPSSSQRR